MIKSNIDLKNETRFELILKNNIIYINNYGIKSDKIFIVDDIIFIADIIKKFNMTTCFTDGVKNTSIKTTDVNIYLKFEIKLHDQVEKYLIENCELEKMVDLDNLMKILQNKQNPFIKNSDLNSNSNLSCNVSEMSIKTDNKTVFNNSELQCECGKIIKKTSYNKHIKSKYHFNNLSEKIIKKSIIKNIPVKKTTKTK